MVRPKRNQQHPNLQEAIKETTRKHITERTLRRARSPHYRNWISADHLAAPDFAGKACPPDEVTRVFGHPGVKVFLAIGRSGSPKYLRDAALALRDSDHNVVIATTSTLDPTELEPRPENIYATRYLPAP